MLVYPNPFADAFTVAMQDAEGALTLELMDLSGRLVQRSLLPNGQRTVQLGEGLPAGSYLLRAVDANGVASVTRLVKR